MKNVKANLVRTLAILALLGLAACGGTKGPQGNPGPAGAPGSVGAQGASAQNRSALTEGGSSGGGGWSAQNSQMVLKVASEKLATLLSNASPGVFSKLPKQWEPKAMAKVVLGVRDASSVAESRSGKELEFDYGSDANGTYIRALRNFYVSYASTAIRSVLERPKVEAQSAKAVVDTIRDVMIKLAKELGHIVLKHPIVKGEKSLSKAEIERIEKEADAFSIALIDALENDQLICVAKKSQGYIEAVMDRYKENTFIAYTYKNGRYEEASRDNRGYSEEKKLVRYMAITGDFADIRLKTKKDSWAAVDNFLLGLNLADQTMIQHSLNKAPASLTTQGLEQMYEMFKRDFADSFLPSLTDFVSGYWPMRRQEVQERISLTRRYDGAKMNSSASKWYQYSGMNASSDFALLSTSPGGSEFLIVDDMLKTDELFLAQFLKPSLIEQLPGRWKMRFDEALGGPQYSVLNYHAHGKLTLGEFVNNKRTGVLQAKIQSRKPDQLKWLKKNVDCATVQGASNDEVSRVLAERCGHNPGAPVNVISVEMEYEKPKAIEIPVECHPYSSVMNWEDYL